MSIDIGAMRELIPTLLISVCGLFLMSTTLHNHLTDEYVQPMHYLFILNSMLSFKNNIELNYADMMSSCVKKARRHPDSFSTVRLIEYVFDSGLKMFFISMSFSILIGVCSNYTNILDSLMFNEPQKNIVLFISTVTSAFFTGACSCISTFICVIVCIFLSISFRFDTDNIILPVIASMSDYICTISLIYFSENFFIEANKRYPFLLTDSSVAPYKFYHRIFVTNCILIVLIVLILGMLYSRVSDSCHLRLFSPWSLCGSFAITMFAGSLINTVSANNMWLGCIIPLFNGVAGSIILIYVGKLTTFMNSKSLTEDEQSITIGTYEEGKTEDSQENPNTRSTLYTLIITSSCLTFVSCLFLKFFFYNMPSFYIVLFGALLNLDVILLYYLTNTLVFFLQHFQMDISYHIVPLLNAFSDLIGICILGGVSYLIL